jgi:hypothetical protein
MGIGIGWDRGVNSVLPAIGCLARRTGAAVPWRDRLRNTGNLPPGDMVQLYTWWPYRTIFTLII